MLYLHQTDLPQSATAQLRFYAKDRHSCQLQVSKHYCTQVS